MHNRSSIKRARDANPLAKSTAASDKNDIDQHTEIEPAESGKNPAAVALGRLGGLKGGRARAAALSPEHRSAIARKAAKTRWQKNDD